MTRSHRRNSVGGAVGTRAAGRFAGAIALVVAGVVVAGCSGSKSAEVRFDDVVVHARVADEPAERQRGLQGYDRPAPDEGMLFVWPDEDERTFAIKEVGYPLDLVFVNRAGEVVGLGALDPVGSRVVTGPNPASYVLEVAAGFIERHEIAYGDDVVIEGLR